MPLNESDVRRLRNIIRICEELLSDAVSDLRPSEKGAGSEPRKRIRRSGKELIAFRKMLLAERKKGVPVAELARKHGVSTAYIYQL